MSLHHPVSRAIEWRRLWISLAVAASPVLGRLASAETGSHAASDSQVAHRAPGPPLTRPSPRSEVLIGPVVLREVTMMEAVNRLRDQGAMVCLEEVELDPVRDRTLDSAGRPTGVIKRRFSLDLGSTTLGKALDRLCAADREYDCARSRHPDVWHVFPRSKTTDRFAISRLNWKPGPLKSANRLELLKSDLDLQPHDIYFLWMGMDYDAYNVPVRLPSDPGCIRDVLDTLALVSPPTCWTLAGMRGSRFLTLYRMRSADTLSAR